MVFWVLVVIAAVLVVYLFADGWWEDGPGWAFVSGFFASLISVALLGVYVALTFGTGWGSTPLSSTPQKYDLRAVVSDSKLEGRVSGGIFVVGGYMNEKQVFSYIRDSGDGGSVLRQAPAGDTVIYEGFDAPTVEFKENTFGNPWLYPFTITDNQEFVFRVPSGSVSNQIQVTP